MGYAPPMQFAREDLDRLDAAEEVEIETFDGSGEGRRTTIWIVVETGEVFVRSYLGERGRWYRDCLADPRVAVHVGGRRIGATVEPADDDGIARTSAALRQKYDGDPATDTMVARDVLATTLRLLPA
jgi:hypothetical protein